MTGESQEQELRVALQDFLAAAAERRGNAIAGALDRVLELEARLRPDAPPMLRHYLERRSYQKAYDFLSTGAPETETPGCTK